MGAPSGIDWEWATRTGGNLSAHQKRQLVVPLVRMAARYPAMRVRLALGRRGTAQLDLDALVWPDSTLARAAEAEAREILSPYLLEHSYRTYVFGRLLAQMDRVAVDEELTFVSSMLHDSGFEHPTPGRCFAVVGGERAERFAADHAAASARAAQIGAAIAGHLTVGVAEDLSDPAGFVSAGSLVDITGFRLAAMDPRWVDDLHARHPRHDLRRRLPPAWKAEGRAVPGGRAQWITRYGAFPMLVRFAPFRE
jgi:hypothetical protein